MRSGRRFFSFWLLLLTACISGCCGCGACGECNDGCNIGPIDFCADGSCGFGGNGDAGRAEAGLGSAVAIVKGLSDPTALTTDGTELYYVDRGTLFEIDVDGTSMASLATGVGNVGNIATDGMFVYWVGTWNDEASDAGGEAGDSGDASSDDGGDGDAGDGGSGGNLGIPGVFRIPVAGGDVTRIRAMDALPTIETAGMFLWLRMRTDDAGASALGMLDVDDGGFASVVALSGDTENMHAFAIGPNGIVALDADGIVTIGDAGKTLLATGASGSGLLGTTEGVVDVTTDDASFRVLSLGDGASVTGNGRATAIAAFGNRIFVADREAAGIYGYTAGHVLEAPALVSTSGVVSFVTADEEFVYWIAAGSVWRDRVP